MARSRNYKTNDAKGKNDREKRENRNRNGSRSCKMEDQKMEGRGYSKRERNSGYDHNDVVGANDPRWYRTLPELTDAAARFPYSRPLGVPLSWGDFKGGMKISPDFPESLPGIMTLRWTPTIGNSRTAVSAVNVASREVYSFVRHANSGHVNYDSPDLMIYLLAMDSIYSMYTAAVRIYGLANMYTSSNRYMPKYLIEALDWDFDDIIANQAQFRAAINNIAYKISSFNVPNFMSYFIRHMWMNSGVYTDKPSAKAQMYAYLQDGYYAYQANINATNYGGLKYQKVPHKLTVSGWRNIMDDLIDPILGSEDFGIMSGDILKAFGMGNLFSVAPIPLDYIVTPMYSSEVLSQIQNANCVGAVWASAHTDDASSVYYTPDIVQAIEPDTWMGYLYSNVLVGPVLEATDKRMAYSEAVMQPRLVTSDSDNPTVDEIMVSTRLTNCPNVKVVLSDGVFKYGWTDDAICSTELLNEVNMFYLNNGELKSVSVGSIGIVFDHELETNDMIKFGLHLLSKFDWMPTLTIGYRFKSDESPMFGGYFQDTNNYTQLLTVDLTSVHEAALMSEFYIPQTGSATRKPITN